MSIAKTCKRIELADWRRKTIELYADVRNADDPIKAWKQYTQTRNILFKHHPQSPLTDQQQSFFSQLNYFPYNHGLCVTGNVDCGVEQSEVLMELEHDGHLRMTRVATIHFKIAGQAADLNLYWIEGYGGGLFLPFRDLSNQTETYGGGRYLYDTIKGADLGVGGQKILLDFNFAYNPSCAYNPRWFCPLPPPANSLNVFINAGEKRFSS